MLARRGCWQKGGEQSGGAHPASPADELIVLRPGAVISRQLLLVPPVRCDTVLGDVVHLGCADLNLDRHAIGARHHRVQGPVSVVFRVPNVILRPRS